MRNGPNRLSLCTKFDAKNLTTLYNLALILGDQGRLDEWAEINKVLELAGYVIPIITMTWGSKP